MVEQNRSSYYVTQFLDVQRLINKRFTDTNRLFYPPKRFSRAGSAQAENVSSKKHGNHGSLLISEAIAIYILLDEACLYATEKKLDNDVLDGFGSFGDMLGEATSVRSKVTKNLQLVLKYKPAFDMDKGIMGEAVTEQIMNRFTENLEKDSESIFGKDSSDVTVKARIANRIKGAQLARAMYLEILSLSKSTK